jgi:hypothetical protein
MKGKREKEGEKRNGKRGQFPGYDSLDFSLFTGLKNAAGGLFQHPARADVVSVPAGRGDAYGEGE